MDKHAPGPVELLARVSIQSKRYQFDGEYRDAVDNVIGNPLYDAAPELLEALKEARELIKFYHGEPAWDIYDKQSPEMKRINNAIDKATLDRESTTERK